MLEGHHARAEREAYEKRIADLEESLQQQMALTAEYRSLFETWKRKANAYLRTMTKETELRMAAQRA